MPPVEDSVAYIAGLANRTNDDVEWHSHVHVSQLYFTSIYWSLTMLMKSPHIGPDTWIEKLFGCLMVLLGLFVTTQLVAVVTQVVMSFDKVAPPTAHAVCILLSFSLSLSTACLSHSSHCGVCVVCGAGALGLPRPPDGVHALRLLALACHRAAQEAPLVLVARLVGQPRHRSARGHQAALFAARAHALDARGHLRRRDRPTAHTQCLPSPHRIHSRALFSLHSHLSLWRVALCVWYTGDR
jgi:hypothetical protein